MVKSFSGWFKIYLFYGVVFFLLGLFGSLASDQVRLQTWSERQKEKLAKVWPYLLKINEGGPVVPAFTNRSNKIILQVYDPENQQAATPFKSLVEGLHNVLKDHFQQVLIMPVENLNFDSWEASSLYGSSILIGFKKTQETSTNDFTIRNQFFFGMAEADSSLVAGKLTQELAGHLKTFYLRKENVIQTTIYELVWDQESKDDNQESEAFSAFMHIMNQDVVPNMSSSNLE